MQSVRRGVTTNQTTAIRLLIAGIAFGASACGGNNVIGPENQLEVTNVPDSFEWQVTALDNVSQTFTYAWGNTGTAANVNQSSALASGTASLRITDAGGVEVYSRSLSEDGTFVTGSGMAGTWTVTVTLEDVDGTLNFRLEKP
ncbi:MAG: hypothetical protein KJO18_07085 [Acidimicrobiia bacterium]|nr:hypothetical protein [Acidimicrobiia bacterium]